MTCLIFRHLPLSRSKAALAVVCRQWARCLRVSDSYLEAIGYRNGRLALQQSLQQHGPVNLDDLHFATVQAEIECTRVIFSRAFANLTSLTLKFQSHDQCIALPTVTADVFPHLEFLSIDNKGDKNSTDQALEWDLRAMPALQQVPCDSLNSSLEWDLGKLPNLKRIHCGSTRVPNLQVPEGCAVDLALQLFMQQAACMPDTSTGLSPWRCAERLHLDRLWVGSSVLGEHPGRNQRLELLGSMLNVKQLSLAVHFGDVLAASGGKLIFPENVCFERCDIHAMIHGRHAPENCIGLCEKSIDLPEGWRISLVACGRPNPPSSTIRGHWKGLDCRYYDPSEQTYAHLQLLKIEE